MWDVARLKQVFITLEKWNVGVKKYFSHFRTWENSEKLLKNTLITMI